MSWNIFQNKTDVVRQYFKCLNTRIRRRIHRLFVIFRNFGSKSANSCIQSLGRCLATFVLCWNMLPNFRHNWNINFGKSIFRSVEFSEIGYSPKKSNKIGFGGVPVKIKIGVFDTQKEQIFSGFHHIFQNQIDFSKASYNIRYKATKRFYMRAS